MLPKATPFICLLVASQMLAPRSTLAQERQLGQYVPVTETYELPIPITLSEGVVAELPNHASHAPVVDSAARPEASAVLAPQMTPATSDSHLIEQGDTASSVMRLPPRDTMESEHHNGQRPNQQTTFGNPVRTLSSLAFVLGLFFLFLRFARRYRVPAEEGEPLFDTLGRVSLLGKRAHIVRFGSKLLVLAKTSNGLEKLTELSDPREVEQVIELCRSGSEKRLNQGLRNLLSANSLRPAA
jgi:flagellar biogenesis protein FliO